MDNNTKDVLVKEYKNVPLDTNNLRINDIDINFTNNKNNHYDCTIIELFEYQVSRVPNNIAVSINNIGITYDELNKRVNKLAWNLRGLGVNRNDVISIISDKSIEMIIGVLAVIKSGAAYLPIDTDFPDERIKYILNNSKSKFLLYNLKNELPEELTNIVEKAFDLRGESIYSEKSENLPIINNPSDLLYIIYTSGTTGQPKGVMIKHENLDNYLMSLDNLFKNGFSEFDKVLSISNYAFDVSVSEYFMSLTRGCTLVLSHSYKMYDAEEIAELIIKKDITFTYIPPSLLNAVCDFIVLSRDKIKLNKLFIGVEPILGRTAKRFLDLCSMEIINCYGPSEATICSTIYKVNGREIDDRPMPIGKPLLNSNVYILDKDLKILPVGEIGELCVGGAQVGLGYLYNEKLTNEKFIENPYKKGTLMYKTGDLAKWLPNGNVEFCGRIDNQVKIRGFRVELEEIKCKLLEFDNISEAVVLVKEVDNFRNKADFDKNTDNIDSKCVEKVNSIKEKAICAYLAYKGNLDLDSLKYFLREKLPYYMIPSYFVKIDRIPLTLNGKIDRNKLLSMDLNSYMIKGNNAAKTKTEEKISSLFSELLGINDISISDSFLELCVNSLNLAKLALRIENVFDIKLSVSQVFSMPTVKELAYFIDNSSIVVDKQCIVKAEEKPYYVASPAQKRMFLLQQFDKRSVAYNVPMMLQIDCKIDETAINNIFKKLIENHEAFRTYFEVIDGEIVQKVLDNIDFNIEFKKLNDNDLDSLSESEFNKKIQAMIREFVSPFDLSKAPLLRVKLIQASNKSYLFMDMHHIIVDGMSANILIGEIITLYNGGELEQSDIEYKDYSEWLNSYLKTDEMRKQEEYWLNKFSDEIPVLNLPLDYERPVIQSFKGDRVYTVLDYYLFEELKCIQKENASTMYMIMLAFVSILLSKYSSQEDIIIGSPIMGRPNVALSNIIGMFVNTIAFRNKPTGDKTFSEFLEEVKYNSLEAYRNQDYQFDSLINKLNLDRVGGRNPLFDVVLNIQDTVNVAQYGELMNLPINFILGEDKVAKFDLTFSISTENNVLRLGIEYCTALFKRETVNSMLNFLINIIKQVVKNKDIKIKDIELIDDSERFSILYDFNDTKVKYDNTKTIVELFENQVLQNPHQIAVELFDEKISYIELNNKVNSLAYTLRKDGVKPFDKVAIITDRSIDMIVGILAVIKAGGAYLPIDADYPLDRKKYILQDSNCKFVLYKLNSNKDSDLFSLVEKAYNLDDENIYSDCINNLPLVNKPSDLLYVIYTSGTTGQPKGVMIKHENLTNYICSLNMLFKNGFSVNDKILSLTNYVFDVSVSEFFIALTSGCTLVLNDKHKTFDVREISDIIIEKQITYTYIPPMLLNMVCDRLIERKEDVKLDKMFIGVEPIKGIIIKKFLEINKDMEVINCYGPSEATICSAIYKATGDEDNEKNMPIGKPLNNSYLYIVNKGLQLLPIGVVGELCVSGAQVGLGYLNKKELTEEKFVPNPFLSGTIIYKTGDLAKWLPDGNVEFVGRVDNQVKIRGYRVELGEIECKIKEYKYIKEAVVIAREVLADKKSNDRSKYVCAYVVVDENYDEKQLIDFLQEKLPEYMVPTYFVKLDKIPLTPNGKLDKKSLPVPEYRPKEHVLSMADTKKETDIIEAFRYVLKIDDIKIDDDYFKDLGGDSLKAINVIGILSDKYNINLNQLFEYPTAKLLANHIRPIDNLIYKQLEALKSQYINSTNDIADNVAQADVKQDELLELNYIKQYNDRILNYDNFDYSKKKQYKNILLTGATGYLGVYLLNSLLCKTNADIYTLVRADNNELAVERLTKNIKFYFGDNFIESYIERIHVLCGDFSEIKFGLEDKIYYDLSVNIDCIMHCGGNTNHFGKYEIYEKANVMSTQYMIDFAKYNHKKDINYISTVSVFEAPYKDKKVVNATEFDLDLGQDLSQITVYPKSKYEAEKLLHDLMKENVEDINVNIFRIGNISFNSKNGSVQRNIENNASLSTMKCFIKLGAIPKNLYEFECGYVDFISDAVAELFSIEQLHNEIYHIQNTQTVPMSDILTKDEFNLGVIEKDMTEFINFIEEKLNDSSCKEYINTLATHMFGVLNNTTINARININSQKTDYILSKVGLSWRKPDDEEIKRFIEYCKNVKFI